MKLCKNCKFCAQPANRFSKCLHPSSEKTPGEIDPVTGFRIIPESYYAVVARKGYTETDCGPDAKYFAPKDATSFVYEVPPLQIENEIKDNPSIFKKIRNFISRYVRQ